MSRNEAFAIVGIMLVIFGSFILFSKIGREIDLAKAELKFKRDKAHQKLVVQKNA